MKKKFVTLFLAALLAAAALSGCGDTQSEAPAASADVAGDVTEDTASADAVQDDEEDYTTGDASLDDPRNQDEIGEKELLVVSFGTSYNDSRRLTIGAIEDAMDEAFADEYSIRRGFTSQIIIDHVASRDGEVIDNVTEALDRAVANGVKTLVVQPTHLMNGYEYTDLENELKEYEDSFEQVALGSPLLTSDKDFEDVMHAITEATAEYDDGETAIIFMGHGTEADSNGVYEKMQQLLKTNGYANYFIGTVEAAPSLQDVMTLVKEGDYKKVVLEPLMIVAGDHANNDMAGDEEDSWKSTFEAEGYEVECILRGLGELPAIQEIFVEHAKDAAATLENSSVASSEEMAVPQAVGEEGMEPVYGSDIADGTYQITVDSSSAMFRITNCELKVKDGKMTAKMTMGGTGYLYVYMGTGEEAVKADETDYIPYEEQNDGTHTFTVPVEALDQEISCTAFSKRKEKWYDRTLVFRADSL
jgi:sirohydrochlorin cobaltochelatase